MKNSLPGLACLFLLAFASTPAVAQSKAGDAAPEFPLGLFADGKSYQMSDFKGKVVVLFFYESDCPRCKGSIPERNEVVKAFEGKPVKFIAIGASDTLASVTGYGRETKLQMPIFADSMGLMEARYGLKISLQNIWQFRVIGPDGTISGNSMDKATIERSLEKAAWKYDPKDYDAKLKLALDAFEWNQWDAGTKLLTPLRRSPTKALAESANKLYAALKVEAEAWKTEAEGLAESEPAKAHELYSRITANFPGEAISKEVGAAKQKLSLNKIVLAEATARKAYAQLGTVAAGAVPAQKAELAKQLNAFAKKYPGTPSAEKASAAAKELEKKD